MDKSERSDMVEREFRQEFKEIRGILSEMNKSLAVLNTKQHTAFNLGAWILQIVITVVVAGITGHFTSH